jgi:hypothetical protein
MHAHATSSDSNEPFTLSSRTGPTLACVRKMARLADLLLVVFLVCLAITTTAQVRHNRAVGAHGRAPHDRPLTIDIPVR